MIQETDDYGWLSSFREQHNATAGLPTESPERAAPIPMAPEVDETADWLRQYRARAAGFTLGDLGIYQVPMERAQALLDLAEVPVEAALPGKEDAPYFGYGFALANQAQALLAQAKIKKRTATAEDEELYLSYLVDAARQRTFGAGMMEALYGILSTGTEVATGGAAVALGKVAVKKGAKAAGSKLFSEALEKGAAEATSRSMKRAALETGAALAAATGLQEVVPSLAGGEGLTGGGAWTLQSVQQLLGREMTDEEAQEIVDAKNALVPVLLEQSGGLMDGMVRQSISMGVEGTGPILGKLPVVAQIDLLTGMLFTKLAGKVGKGGWSKAVMEIAQQQGVGSEIAEEFADSILTASIMGDKPIAQALMETAEQVPEFGSALLLLRGGMAGAQRAKGALGAKLRPSGSAPATAHGATEGGEPKAAPSPDAEGAAATEDAEGITPPVGLSPEKREMDAVTFRFAASKALGREVGDVRVAEAETEEEVAVERFMRRHNVEPTFVDVEGDTTGLPVAFTPAEGRAVVVRRAGGVAGPALEEMMHSFEAQQPRAKRSEYGRALRDLDPEFVDRVGAWVAQQPVYKDLPPEAIQEEKRTNVARFTAGLVMYLDTPAGRSDFETLWAKDPGPIRKALGAAYDWIASKIRALPQRKRALARARLRVARNEQDVTKVAMRVLEAFKEIRPAGAAEPASAEAPRFAARVPKDLAALRARVDEVQAKIDALGEEPAGAGSGTLRLARDGTRPLTDEETASEQARASWRRKRDALARERIDAGNALHLAERDVTDDGDGGQRFAAAPDSNAPREFTYDEYFGQAARSAMGRPPQPPGPRATLPTPSPAKVTSYLESAVQAAGEQELPREDTTGRPDLNVPLDTPEGRTLLRAVDEARKVDQESIPNAQTHALASSLFSNDPEGARRMIEDQLASGAQLSAVDTVVGVRVMEDLARHANSAEGTRDDYVDFLRFGNAFREARANTARSLQITRGLGIAADMAWMDVLSTPTRSVRREVRRIHTEAPGLLGSRTRKRQSPYILGQMGKPRQRSPRFAAAFDPQTGRPITQERLDFLQAKLDAIEAVEAGRMEQARRDLAANGYDLSKIGVPQLLDPNEGWKIKRIVSMAKASRDDKVQQYLLGAYLSGIFTQVRNNAGNAANFILSGPVQLAAEAAANMVVRDRGSAQWGDVKAYMAGLMHSFKPAALNALRAWRTESPVFELDLVARGVQIEGVETQLERFDGPAIKNPILGRGLRSVSLNLLLAGDEFWKTLAATAWAHGLSFRQAKMEGLAGDALTLRSQALLDDYTGDLWVESAYKGREATFQDKGNTFMEGVQASIMDLRNLIDDISTNIIKLPVGFMVLPFVKTPLRIAANVVRRSPIQPLVYAGAVTGRYKHNRQQLVGDLADTLIAYGLFAAVSAMLDAEDDEGRPFITGSTPKSKAERDLWYRLGIDPLSLRVNGTYYSYRNVEPLATIMGVLVDGVRSARVSGDPVQSVPGILSSLAQQSKDKTFLRTLGDLQLLMERDGSSGRKALDMASYTFISSWVPNVIKQTARATDPMVRESSQPVQGESIWYEAAKGLPYDALPIGAMAPEVRFDLWGRPITKPGPANLVTGTLARLLNPTPAVGDVETASKLDLALLGFNRKVESGEIVDERPVYPGAPAKVFSHNGEKQTWNPTEFTEYVRRSGELARTQLEERIASGKLNWSDPTRRDIDVIEDVIRSSRARVKRELLRARGN